MLRKKAITAVVATFLVAAAISANAWTVSTVTPDNTLPLAKYKIVGSISSDSDGVTYWSSPAFIAASFGLYELGVAPTTGVPPYSSVKSTSYFNNAEWFVYGKVFSTIGDNGAADIYFYSGVGNSPSQRLYLYKCSEAPVYGRPGLPANPICSGVIGPRFDFRGRFELNDYFILTNVAPVPEPSSILTLLCGVGGITCGFIRKRK